MGSLLSSAENATTWLNLIKNLFSGVLEVLTKHGVLPEEVRKFIIEHSAWLGLLGMMLLLAVLWLVLRSLFTLRSRLLQPDRFLLRAEDPRHLKGREEEIAELSDLCRDNPLVFLEGESGAGKSALVRAGLVSECKLRERLHPVYVDLSGAGWEARLLTLVCREMWLSLSEKDREVLGLKAPPRPGELFSLLGRFTSGVGRTPLLIFDQFDDYQSTYRDRFREGHQGSTWITKEMLVHTNSFWMEVARLLRDDTAHCLFITRTDNAAGLDAVRFVKTRTRHLARLNGKLIAPLLDEITAADSGGRPVVCHPERGWEQLKKRLLRDLARDGLILPVQLSVALQALRRLPVLTVGQYERRGGCEGLERFHIERHILEASQASGLAPERIRKLLVSLVEPIKGKTIQLSTSELLSVLQPADEPSRQALSQQLQRTLECLEGRSIIRRRPADDKNEDAWLLHHDFLCRGLLAAERHANRWHALIREQARQYGQSAGLLRRWKALLSPWQQMRLVTKRLAGRFRYAEHRPFALISTLRFTPLLLLLALLWLVPHVIQVRQDDHLAAQIFAAIKEDKQIRVMASASERVQWKVLQLVFESEANAKTALDRIAVLIHTCVGLDPTGALSRRFWKEIAQPVVRKKRDAHTLLLAAVGWREAPGEPADAQRLADALVEAVSREEPGSDNFYYFRTFSPGIAALAPALNAAAAQSLAEKLLQEWDKKRSVKGISSLSEGLELLAEKFTQEQALRTARHFVDSSIEEKDDRLSWPCMKAASLHLDSPHAAELAEKYLNERALQKQPYSTVWQFRWSFSCLLDRLDIQAKSAIAKKLGAAIVQTSDTFTLVWFTRALELVADQSESGVRERAIERVTDAMEHQDDTEAIAELSQALGTHASAVSPGQGRRAAGVLLRAMEREKRSDLLVELGEGLRAFSGWLEPDAAQWACEKQLKEMEHALNSGLSLPSGYIDGLIQNLVRYAEPLSEAQRLAVLDRILSVVDHNKYTEGLSFAGHFKDFTRLLEKEQAHARIERLVQAIEQEENARSIHIFCNIATSLGMSDNAKQMRRVGERVVSLMETPGNLYKIYELAWSLEDIHEGIGGDLARRGEELLVEALIRDAKPPSGIELRAATSVARIGSAMDPGQAQKTLSSIMEYLAKNGDGNGWILFEFCRALEPLWRRAPDEKLRPLAEIVAARLAWLSSQGPINAPGTPEEIERVAGFLRHAPDQTLLDVLKQPFAVDSTRRIILRAFDLKHGRGFQDNLRNFVNWVTTDPATRSLNLR